MEISKGIEIVDLAIYIKDESTLIFGDLHIGYEEYIQKKGILLPKFQTKEIIDTIKSIIKKTNPNTIIINGDLKHDFGKNSEQEWKDIFKIINLIKSSCKTLIFIKGNHDNFLKTIAAQKNITVLEKHQIKDTLITHGDKLIETNAKRIIISHEHPAITLKDQGKIEKYKCFLKGKWNNKELIVLPSMNPLSYGSDVFSEKNFSPFVKDKSNFEVFISNDGEVFNFGKVKDFSGQEIN
jgi:uncharacterized protein